MVMSIECSRKNQGFFRGFPCKIRARVFRVLVKFARNLRLDYFSASFLLIALHSPLNSKLVTFFVCKVLNFANTHFGQFVFVFFRLVVYFII